MIYFRAGYGKSEIVYAYNKRTETVTWTNPDGTKGSVHYPINDYHKYIEIGLWVKCTKRGLPLESKK